MAGMGYDIHGQSWGFLGLGAAKMTAAQRKTARQTKTAARQAARQVKIAGRTVTTTANPSQVAALERSLTSLQSGQKTLVQLAQKHQRTKSVADRNALINFAKKHLQNLKDASGSVDPTAAKIAQGAASKATAHNAAVKQTAAQRRAANVAARAQKRMRGFGWLGDSSGSCGGDPTCCASDTSGDPTCISASPGIDPNPSAIPMPYDPTGTGYPLTAPASGGFDMSSMLPLLLMGGGIGGGTAGTSNCNPNLPRCIIANMAAQDRQQFMFIIMIIMLMQQQATSTLSQSLGAGGLYNSQYPPPYAYGQTSPYGTPPYGDPSQMYGGGYPGAYGGYGYSPYGPDSSQIPPGFDASGGGDMFAPGSGNMPSDINSIYPGPGPGSGNLISSNQLPDGLTDTDGNIVGGGDGGSGQGQSQPQVQSPMYAQSTSVSQGPMSVMMAPTPYMQPQLQYTDFAYSTPNAVNYPYSQAMPPQMPGAGQAMQPILMPPLQSPPEMENPDDGSDD